MRDLHSNRTTSWSLLTSSRSFCCLILFFQAEVGLRYSCITVVFFFQAEDGIRDVAVTGVQTCALPIFGGILGGVFTATEAGALAVPYALVLAMGVYRELGWRDLPGVLVATLKDTAAIFVIIAVAGIFGYVITVLGVGVALIDFVTGLTKSPWVVLLLLNILFLIIGLFVDVTATMLVFAPLFAKVVAAYHIDPVHFAVVFVLNVSIGMMTPPYGLTMYLMLRIADITMIEFIRAMWPFLTALLVALFLITYIPAITLWLPNLVLGAR